MSLCSQLVKFQTQLVGLATFWLVQLLAACTSLYKPRQEFCSFIDVWGIECDDVIHADVLKPHTFHLLFTARNLKIVVI